MRVLLLTLAFVFTVTVNAQYSEPSTTASTCDDIEARLMMVRWAVEHREREEPSLEVPSEWQAQITSLSSQHEACVLDVGMSQRG
jgi:hypothetical protein